MIGDGKLMPIMGIDTVGQTPADFSDERNFYNPVEGNYERKE